MAQTRPVPVRRFGGAASALFVAAADAVEEAILNAMLGADDLSGCGNTVLALKPERLLAALQQVGWKAS